MTEKLEMYRCDVCGNLVQVLISGEGELVCCGKPMVLINPNTSEDASLEKHVPVFIKDAEGRLEIQVGSVPHPMEDKHYIMFIETISGDKNHVALEYLHPEQEPKMRLEMQEPEKAIAFCNIHGLWEGKKSD